MQGYQPRPPILALITDAMHASPDPSPPSSFAALPRRPGRSLIVTNPRICLSLSSTPNRKPSDRNYSKPCRMKVFHMSGTRLAMLLPRLRGSTAIRVCWKWSMATPQANLLGLQDKFGKNFSRHCSI